MNIMQIMKQAQNIQAKLKSTQEELAGMTLTGEAANGAVVVSCDGQGKFKSINLKPEAICPENPSSVDRDSLEMLEDIIATAINNAESKAAEEMNSRMKAATGGLNIPGLF